MGGSMSWRRESNDRAISFAGKLGAVAILLICLGCVLPVMSWAGYEETGIFAGSTEPPVEPGVFPEDVQLGGNGGLAVNISGAGGVPAGTLYAAGYILGELWISRYEPSGESMKFVEAWEVSPTEGPITRCGPSGPKNCKARPEGGAAQVDVDVDQVTGSVYVYNGLILTPGAMVIAEFTPNGSEVLARFGEKAISGKTTAETPGQIHRAQSSGAIAVNKAGEVYVFDINSDDNFYHRVMVFKLQAGKYVYAGQGQDIGAGFLGATEFPTGPVTDSAGHVYVAGEGYVQEYDPAKPAAPICRFVFSKGGITAATPNPETGEVYFYTYNDKSIHRLAACNGEGKFLEVGSPSAVSPERSFLSALVFDPKRQLSPSRPAGTLYAAAPSAVPGVGKGQPGRGSLGYIFALGKELPPVVEAESASNVMQTTAQVRATINPKGSATRYVFQYLSETAFDQAGETFIGASEAPMNGGEVGGGSKGLVMGAMLTGLQPDTDYRFRAVATSNCSQNDPEKVCEDAGAGGRFRTYPPEPATISGRAYELVSPADKHGGQVLPADPTISSCGPIECKPGSAYRHFPMQATSDGNAIVYEGTAFGAGESAVIENQYVAHRDPTQGWNTKNLTPPLLQSKGGQGYKAFDSELKEGILEQTSPTLSSEAPADYTDLYRQPTSSPLSLSPLLTEAPPNRVSGSGAGRLKLNYAGGSADLSRHFFEANDALTSDALDGGESKNNLYEWVGGQLHLVNLAPGDTESIVGAVFGSGQQLKSGNPNNFSFDFSNAVSNDGSRVFWSSESGQVYIRIGGGETRKIEDGGRFLTASADGSQVLLSDGCLYKVATEQCQDLTTGKGGFKGIAGQSDDLSEIYFVDTAVLTGEEKNAQGNKALAGSPNLYAWSQGAVTYIATLVSADNVEVGTWQAAPGVRTAEASPAGRFLAFVSRAPLTGYDNIGPCESDHEGGFLDVPCPEVFLFDSAQGDLLCASCNPSNARPLGWAVLRFIFEASGSIDQPRYLTDSGRLYFDSEDSLVPADTNDGAEDVYQFEPGGVGPCSRGEGCVSLLSGGRNRADSNFLAMDATGKNIFFTTRDRLVPADNDELVDLYDAREGGGFAFESELPPGKCTGETCQPPPPSIAPVPPASSTLVGSENVRPSKPKKCKKGKVKRGGKCIKKQGGNKAKRLGPAGRERGGSK